MSAKKRSAKKCFFYVHINSALAKRTLNKGSFSRVKLLRSYFPNGSIDRALDRLGFD